MKANNEKNIVGKFMGRLRKDVIPSSEEIVNIALERLGLTPENTTREQVRRDFNEMFRKTYEETLNVLEEFEEKAYPRGIPSSIAAVDAKTVEDAENIAKEKGFFEGVLYIFENWYSLLRKSFLSVSQSRKSRGGKDFENTFAAFLKLMDLPYEDQIEDYNTDFVLPNVELFKTNKTQVAIVSAKRTLRERWSQVVEELENTRAPNLFLLTYDDSISDTTVKAIQEYGIHLLVLDEVKNGKFPDNPYVIGLSAWVTDRIEVLENYWK